MCGWEVCAPQRAWFQFLSVKPLQAKKREKGSNKDKAELLFTDKKSQKQRAGNQTLKDKRRTSQTLSAQTVKATSPTGLGVLEEWFKGGEER